MRLVIDIPDEMYDWLVNGFPDEEDYEELLRVIKNGTMLNRNSQRRLAKEIRRKLIQIEENSIYGLTIETPHAIYEAITLAKELKEKGG